MNVAMPDTTRRLNTWPMGHRTPALKGIPHVARTLRGCPRGCTPARWLIGLFWLFAITGCVFLAPIEEEEPDPDDPPRFSLDSENTEPPLGDQPIIMQPGGGRFYTIRVGGGHDNNLEQTLYWRAVVDYANFAIATQPTEVPPENRESAFVYQYNPCVGLHPQLAEDPSDHTHALYMAISDAPFVDTAEFFDASDQKLRLQEVFKTEPEGRVTLIFWTLELSGSCFL